MSLKAEEVEILAVKEHSSPIKHQSGINLSSEDGHRVVKDVHPDSSHMQILEREETLAGIVANYRSTEKYLVSVY